MQDWNPSLWCRARSQSPCCAVDRETEVLSQAPLSRANSWSKQHARWPCDDAGDAARLTQARGVEDGCPDATSAVLAEEERKGTGP